MAELRSAAFALAMCVLALGCGREAAGPGEVAEVDARGERISATAAAHLERTFDELLGALRSGYVYGTLRHVDWDALRIKHRGRLSEVGSVTELGVVVQSMLQEIGDPDIVWQSREERIRAELDYSTRYEGIGTYISFRDAPVPRVLILDVMPGSPAERSGLLPHDAILAIDGSPVRAGEGTSVAQRIRGPGGTPVRILVKRPGARARELSVTRAPVELAGMVYPVRSGFVGSSGVAYILLPRSAGEDLAGEVLRLMESLGSSRRLSGLLLDLRISGAGAFPLVELLTLFGDGVLGVTYTTQASEELAIEGQDQSGSQTIPLGILVGPETEGAAEIFAAALQATRRAIVVGAATPGSVEREQQTALVDGSRLWMPVWSYRAPDGREVGLESVRPDVAVAADWDEVSDASDPVRIGAARALQGGRLP